MKETGIMTSAIVIIEQWTGLPVQVVTLILIYLGLELYTRLKPSEDKGSLTRRILDSFLLVLDILVSDRLKDRPNIQDKIDEITKKDS